jgi:hypothetical protein
MGYWSERKELTRKIELKEKNWSEKKELARKKWGEASDAEKLAKPFAL